MKTKKIIEYVHGFAIIPFLATSISFQTLTQPISFSAISLSEIPSITAKYVEDNEIENLRLEKASKIDTYFKERNMPLYGYGMKMVVESEKYGLDWRLLPAISVRESTGGIHACKRVENNPFGWGSCKIGFESIDKAIEIVAMNLGGENPNTAYHYDGKTTEEILAAYNPPSIVPKYVPQVVAIMDAILNEA